MRYTQMLATLLPLIAASVCEAQSSRSTFDLSKIDAPILTQFQKAWHISGNGLCEVEGVVLLFANSDGSYRAMTLGQTNERRQVTFKWNPAIIAIFHTHPKDAVPEPAGMDIVLADRFGVPIFTLTIKGMFMYDPGTKKVSKIKDGLTWLEQSNWAQHNYVAANKPTIKE